MPASLGSPALPIVGTLDQCVALGVSAVELGAVSIERFLGAPVAPEILTREAGEGFEEGLHPLEEEVLQDEIELARATFADHLRFWRESLPLTSLDPLRRRFEEAGVHIEIVRWDGLTFLSDDEVDYGFRVARALGARILATELVAGGPRRLGPFAEHHATTVGFHGDHTAGVADFAAAFSHGRFNAANIDISEWAAGGHGSSLPFLAAHASRISHVYVSDRVGADPARIGQGEMPIRELLEEMRVNRAPFQATLDLAAAMGSAASATEEVAAALDYCRSCLSV